MKRDGADEPDRGEGRDGTYAAVVDRVEEAADGTDLAVVILEADGEAIDQLVVPTTALPEASRTPDAVLDVVIEDGEVVDATPRPTETDRRAADAQSRFDRLAERPPSGPDDEDDS